MAERAGRETPSLEVAGSNAKRSKFFLIRCLFIFFLSFYTTALLSRCSL